MGGPQGGGANMMQRPPPQQPYSPMRGGTMQMQNQPVGVKRPQDVRGPMPPAKK